MEMTNKVIIAGHLEYGSSRNYDQVQAQFAHRKENYYKNEIFVDEEEIFLPEEMAIEIPRKVLFCTDRQFLNSLNLLKLMTTFAISGDLNIWRLVGGKLQEHHYLEPKGDKSSTQAFLAGRQLLDGKGNEEAAKEKLTRAITKFDRHAQAYERRGYTNYRLGNMKEAIYDYEKSISINPIKPDPYYGLGMINLLQKKDYAAAAVNFEQVTKLSIPHQAIFWRGLVLWADCLVELGKPEEAKPLYFRFSKRVQRHGEELDALDRRVSYTYGKLQAAAGKHADAISAFEAALTSPDGKKKTVKQEDILLQRALAGKAGDIRGWRKNLKEAADAGSSEAGNLLKQLRANA